ncbi:M14 family metallopeptidase [Hymenobacter sp. BT175]|uniref:M14 family metallopeptidase n=1 Tax=Hymenobacter translucens TaxID=2886507 RepID=UPI001D0F2DEF|nr:M14 family metallopeptidase [Hymenobacter translucens]MCC2547036.1 M14 family metallopeptidase [Hymenobacter translucens]
MKNITIAGGVRHRLLLLLLVLLPLAVAAQNNPSAGPLLTPTQFLGYPLGSRFTTHAELLRYVDHVVQHSPQQMRLVSYGRSYEGRPLEVVQIASAENLSRLEEIRRANLQLTGQAEGRPTGRQPALVWLSYNIHGDEAVSSEAVMQVLYDLANPQNPQAAQWLQNVVLLVDPCVNPDGRERYVQWYNRVRSTTPNASPYAWEHQQPWPGGRFNHYYFDLNRDWAWQTQQESRQRVALYNQWLPQVHADFHEMTAEGAYYFSPAAKPYHQDITPFQRSFQNVIGDYNRRVFDAKGWLYFTRETYDLFYPSYGDTWPTFNGAIGMTYEQSGGGRAGLRYARSDGDTLTLAQRVQHHHAASLATIQASADRREELVREFRKYYDDARLRPKGEFKTFVLSGTPEGLRGVTDYLDRQGIRYGYAYKGRRLRGFDYATGGDANLTLKPEDLVVSMYQPKSTLVKVLFEPRAALEDSLTYDITSWAIPYAYGVKGYALRTRLEPQHPKDFPGGKGHTGVGVVGGAKVVPYAYVARWNTMSDLRFLSRLLQQKVRVRVAQRPFEAEGQQYQPGTLVITRAGNEALGTRLDQLIRAQADSAGVLVQAVQSGFSTSGADLGSGYVHSLKAPTVAVVAGPGVSPTAFGEVWHFFEQQLGYPVTVLGADYLSSVPLARFDVLILPDGDYTGIYPERSLESLKQWVRGGGRLIAMEGAAGFLANKKDFALKTKAPDSTVARPQPEQLLRRYADAEREQIQQTVQGSVYRVQLDNTHPLAFGYGSSYYALVRDTLNYRFLGPGGWNVGVLRRNDYAAGFAGSKARRKLTDTFVLGAQEMGRGQVIYLADNPLFRGFWQGGKLLFGNALFMVGQ